MKKGLVALAALLLTVTSFAQQKIKTEDLSKHVGDSVTFCTKIFGGIFLDRSKEQLTLLNAGGNYPNAPLTIVIGSDTRETRSVLQRQRSMHHRKNQFVQREATDCGM